MKWPATNNSAHTSLINRLFPLSWFSKSTGKPGPTPKSSAWKEGRFYSMDEDDAFWRLSFRDERRRSTGGINPLWCDSGEDDSDFRTEMEVRNFNEMVSDIRKMKQKKNAEKLKFDEENASNPCERDVFPVETEIKNGKLREIKIKPDQRRRGAAKTYSPRTERKIRAQHSPRTECKIRALEEMKKARTKAKKKEKVLEGSTVFDSFAVAKSSSDPERDFRESMVEMITERGIGHPQDLEQLLACYLTLNCDQYHDLIIKVFRQVWFELRGLFMDASVQNGLCFQY